MRTLTGVAPAIIISLLLCAPALGETPLARAYAEAWQRQPAAAALGERERAAAASLNAAGAWTAAPPSIEAKLRSDRFNDNDGAREDELGLALPLWLPGERSGSLALAEAEGEALSRRGEALRLRLAQIVREAWWSWQNALNDAALADERTAAARRLRDDVARRLAAGDLSRADLNQAEGALAQALAQQAEAAAALDGARYRLESLTGSPAVGVALEPEPEPVQADSGAAHPLLRELQVRGEVARRRVDLARAQGRANPEVALSARRDRAGNGDPDKQTLALALRIPFSAGPRQDARVALASAEAIELGIEAEREEERLAREVAAGRQQVDAGRRQLAAAADRARFARENRGFYEKSFRLGESDLPTRLRIENEAFEAQRALGRARIALAQGISQLRQSLGLLPE
jgi:cobalt-zinc-cadmium efflux system outer membrane protein